MAKPTFYTAFSNSVNNVIPNLSEEAMKIADLLQELAFNDKLYYIKDEIFNIERLTLNFMKYGRRIDIFYFSGHGVDGCLQLMENYTVQCNIMSDIVNTSLKNAKLIFFNACETWKLATEIIKKRNNAEDPIVLISCQGKINSFKAERFATLLFSQIGQPGTYRDAYDQAKVLMKAIHKDMRFKEFETKKAIQEAGDDFDIGYIELGLNGAVVETAAAAPGAFDEKPAKSSIIGQDKLTRDALTSNYVHEVIESIVTNANEIEGDKLKLLKDALHAAEQIAKGEKKNKQATQIFNQAAEALPGFSSASAFESLINTEKNLDNPVVKNLIKTKDSGTTIGGLIDQVSNLKV